MFYKILNAQKPDYTRIPLPLIPDLCYSLPKNNVVGEICARTACYQVSFYPHCPSEWNKLNCEIRPPSVVSPSVGSFRNKLLSTICPKTEPLLALMIHRYSNSYAVTCWLQQTHSSCI